MNDVQALLNLDFAALILGIFVVMSGIIAMVTIIGKFSQIIGKPVKWVRNKQEDHDLLMKTVQDLKTLHDKHEEDTKQSIRHDKMIKDDLAMVSATMLEIKDEVTLMRTQRDNDKLAEFKDKIGQSYRYYKERHFSDSEPIPYWNHMEKEALEGLIEQYESHGGTNSFVHSIVEPEMQTWKLIE